MAYDYSATKGTVRRHCYPIGVAMLKILCRLIAAVTHGPYRIQSQSSLNRARYLLSKSSIDFGRSFEGQA